MRPLLVTIAVSVLAVAPLSAARADRPPTMDERREIESVLMQAGYIRWGEIEFDDDDGAWEIDGAVFRDGTPYEIDMNSDFRIIKRERDD